MEPDIQNQESGGSGTKESLFLKLADKYNLSEEAPELMRMFSGVKMDFETEDLQLREKLRKDLDRVYWDTVEMIVSRAIKNRPDEQIAFDPDEELLINYGMLDDDFCAGSVTTHKCREHYEETRAFCAPPDESNPDGPAPEIRFLFLTDFIRRRNEQLISTGRREQIHRTIGEIQEKLRELRERLCDLRKQRRELQSQSLHHERLTQIDEEVQKNYFHYLEIEHETLRGVIRKEDRKKYSEFKQRIEALNEEKGFFLMDLTKVGANKRIAELDTAIIDCMDKFVALGYDLYEQLEGIDKDASSRQEYIKWQRHADFMNEIKNLRATSALIGRHSGMPQSPAMSGNRTLCGCNQAEQILKNIAHLDHKLFYGRQTRVKGWPGIVFFPGIGNGIYDWRWHQFFVPLFAPRSIKESMLYACAEWRMETDEEKQMIEGFLQAGKIPPSTSILVYRRKFIEAYIVWMTLEAEGFNSLPSSDVRRWFKRVIGHGPEEKKSHLPGS